MTDEIDENKTSAKKAPARKTPARKTTTSTAKTPAKKTTAKKTPARSTAKDEANLTAEEKAAMKQMVAERKRTAKGANTEADVLAAIAAFDDHDRPIAEGLHALVKEIAPEMGCRTWYGFPAYTDAAGKIVFFYQYAGKFKTRYGTLGFNDVAHLDDSDIWPVTFAITEWTDAVRDEAAALIRRALG